MSDAEKPKPSLRDQLHEQARKNDGNLPPNDPPVEAAMGEPTPRSDQQQVNVWLPKYLIKEMGHMQVDRGCTQRFLIIEALQKAGYIVNDGDLYKDGRSND